MDARGVPHMMNGELGLRAAEEDSKARERMREPMKPKAVKTPFTVDPRLHATAQIVVDKASTIDLAPDGTVAIGADTPVFAQGSAMIASPGDLAGAKAEHVAWSPDGSRIAIAGFEWHGNDMTAHLGVYAWPSGKKLAAASFEKYGLVSHASPGAPSPVVVWAGNDRVVARSAAMSDPKVNTVHVLDVKTGKAASHELGSDKYLFAIAVDGERVFALFDGAGKDAGLAWYDLATFELRGRAPNVWGDCVVTTPSGAWVLGDDHWAWRVDWRSIESKHPAKARVRDPKWKDRIRARWERNMELASRAKAKWDVDHLAYHRTGDEDLFLGHAAQDGAVCVMHLEPSMIAQACALGDGIIVRDGVRVAEWTIVDAELVVTPLVEDPQRATTSKARQRMIAVRNGRLVLGWQKSSHPETTSTSFDLA